MCWSNYITPSKDNPSKSGLYANGLPGVTLNLFDELTKDEQADWEEFWDDIYDRTKINLINDIQTRLADKFHLDLKLVSRETSKFNSENTNSGLAGITIDYDLPKYARLQVLSVGVDSLEDYASPEFNLRIYEDDSNGELLYNESHVIAEGKNTIEVYEDFEVDKIFVAYNASDYRLKSTENKYYANCSSFDKISCTFPCGVYGDYEASVFQVNGGGLNVKFVIYCSIEKFICENLNIFKTALWWRIGLELINERILSDRFNRFTTLTKERADDLKAFYNDEYLKHADNSVKNLRIKEDDICFECKSTVSTRSLLP
jgi:hypothetical protein